MARYTPFTKGMTLVDTDENLNGYTYYGYTCWGQDSAWVILRVNLTETKYRYALGAKKYDENWLNHLELNYKRPQDYKTLNT